MHDVAVKKHKISLWNYLFVPKCTQQNGDRNKMSSRTHKFPIEVLHKFPGSSVGKESACSAGDPGLIPGPGTSHGDRDNYPLQYSWASLVAQQVKNPPVMWRPGFHP